MVKMLALMLLATVLGEDEVTTVGGAWSAAYRGLDEVDGAWILRTDREDVPLEDLVHIRRDSRPRAASLGQVVLQLSGGDLLSGQIFEGSALGITLGTKGIVQEDRQRVKVPLEAIRAVVFPQNVPADQTTGTVLARLEAREGRRDEVILKTGPEMAGIIERFGFNSLELSSDRLGKVTVPYENIRAVRIVEEKPAPDPGGVRLAICLMDGSRITGAPLGSGPKEMNLRSPALGDVVIPISWVMMAYVRGGRSIYVSDLDPIEVESTPFLPDEFPWRPYLNRDLGYGGGPLTLGGIVYPKGLGCHSKVKVTYDLAGRGFASLDGRVGIDDEVAGGKGNVIFRVLLDGREVHSSGEVSHDDGAQPLHVDVKGASRLTLVVDYGKNIHIQDRADWADLRLSR